MAPHGGIFVFPVVGNVAMYVVALVVGSVIGCALLGLLKKDVVE
jgi:PTS system fructose-specific IIC component